MCTLAIRRPSHSVASRQSSTFDEPPGAQGYCLPLQRLSTDAGTIMTVITDVLFRLKLPLNKFRGHCYDGTGNMSGQRTGVAKRTHELESRSLTIILKATP